MTFRLKLALATAVLLTSCGSAPANQADPTALKPLDTSASTASSTTAPTVTTHSLPSSGQTPQQLIDALPAVRIWNSPDAWLVLLSDSTATEAADALADFILTNEFHGEALDVEALRSTQPNTDIPPGLLISIAINGGLFGRTEDPVNSTGQVLTIRTFYYEHDSDEQATYLIETALNPIGHGFSSEEVLVIAKALANEEFLLLINLSHS